MTKPPTDLLVWHAIRYLGNKTERLSFSQLRDYLVPNLLTVEELIEILKRGEYAGVVRRNYYRDGKKTKYWLELGSYTNIDPRQVDMFGSVILMALAYREGREKDERTSM